MTDHIPPQQELEKLMKTVRSKHRMILYNDRVGMAATDAEREECHRDDLWAISTEELEQFKQVMAQTRTDTIREVEELPSMQLEVPVNAGKCADTSEVIRDELRSAIHQELEQLKGQK